MGKLPRSFDDFDVERAGYYSAQWHLHGRGEDVDARSSVQCEAAWRALGSFGDPNVVVGIADDGCMLEHPVFARGDGARMAGIADWAYVRDDEIRSGSGGDADSSLMSRPGHAHGTSMCSLIAAAPIESFPIGVAPACRLLPVRWEYKASRYNITEDIFLRILEFLSDKVDVMVNSWAKFPHFVFRDATIAQLQSFAQTGGRRGKGILFVCAAGNSNCPLNWVSPTPIAYAGGFRRKDAERRWYPLQKASEFRNNLVGLSNVLHIGAVTSLAQRAHYSSYGPGLSCCAPSSNVHAQGAFHVRGRGLTTCFGEGPKVTHNFRGTSGAAAIAAGVAALAFSANPAITASQTASFLTSTASKNLLLEPYPPSPPNEFEPNAGWNVSPVAPFERGEFNSCGWSPWFGHGRIDAYEAVCAALHAIRATPQTATTG